MSMQLQVTIPPGVVPGQQMLVHNPYGGQIAVIVPMGVQPHLATGFLADLAVAGWPVKKTGAVY